jgi:hypothetical protein
MGGLIGWEAGVLSTPAPFDLGTFTPQDAGHRVAAR